VPALAATRLPTSTRRRTGDAVDRRANRGIFDVQLGGVDLRLVGLHRRIQLIDHRFLGVVLLPGRRQLGLHQRGDARQIALRVFQIGLVLRLIGVGLCELRLIGARIDLHQQIAGMDVLAFLKRDSEDLAVDPALDHHGIEGLHRAKAANDDREILGGRSHGQHRHGRPLPRLTAGRLAGRVLTSLGSRLTGRTRSRRTPRLLRPLFRRAGRIGRHQPANRRGDQQNRDKYP
jgi:hypothetical protein